MSGNWSWFFHRERSAFGRVKKQLVLRDGGHDPRMLKRQFFMLGLSMTFWFFGMGVKEPEMHMQKTNVLRSPRFQSPVIWFRLVTDVRHGFGVPGVPVCDGRGVRPVSRGRRVSRPRPDRDHGIRVFINSPLGIKRRPVTTP